MNTGNNAPSKMANEVETLSQIVNRLEDTLTKATEILSEVHARIYGLVPSELSEKQQGPNNVIDHAKEQIYKAETVLKYACEINNRL